MVVTAEAVTVNLDDLFNVDDFIAFLDVQLELSANNIRRKLRRYPSKQSVPWKALKSNGFVSEAQRKFVFWQIAKGNMVVPYPRTGESRSAWRIQSQSTKSELAYLIFSEKDRHEFVQSRKRQHERMTIIGWPTESDMAEKEWPKEVARMNRVLRNFESKTRP